MRREADGKSPRGFYIKVSIQGLFVLGLMLALFFLAAGRLDYWRGWSFSAVMVVLYLVHVFMLRDSQDLVRERMKPGPGTKWWDKIFYTLYGPLFLAVFVVGVLDGGRYQWSGRLPAALYVFGYALFILSQLLLSWAMKTNRFFSSTVRIQSERGHEVVSTGPYARARHPGYLAGIFLGIGGALALGSLWALVPMAAVVVLLLIRTYLEDKTLQAELPGYAEYTARVRHRLIPGIW